MVNEIDKIKKDLSTLEKLVETEIERSKNCDPNIVYPLTEIVSVTDRLFTKYDQISNDPELKLRFNILYQNYENYRGDYAIDCTCKKKNL